MRIPVSRDRSPHIELLEGRRVLFVDGLPYTVLTVEIPWKQSVCGRYAQTMGGYDYLYPVAAQLKLNALKVPIKWSQVEISPGEYDFSYVDHVIENARTNGLRLVLGWFGHYASGDGSIYRNLDTEVFAPMFVIEDEATYPRAVDAHGVVHHNAASYAYSAIVERETAAFSAFMSHIRERDEGTFTVLMIQVENEIATYGLLRQERSMWRDHSDAANALFDAWQEDELSFSARLMARNWIRPLSDAGKAAYPLPLFCNFVGGTLAPHIVGGSPGEDVSIYLEECPSIDFIGLNLYVANDVTVADFRASLDRYRIGRNMVCVTETNSDSGPVLPRLCFDAIARYAAPIIAPWALNISYPTPHEPYVLSDGSSGHGARALAETYGAISLAAAPIAAYAGTDRLVALVPPRVGHGHSGVIDLVGSEVRFTCSENGVLIVIHPTKDEYIIVGCRAGVTIPTENARWPACRQIVAEAGRYEGTEWIPKGQPEWFTFDQTSATVSVGIADPTVVRLTVPTTDRTLSWNDVIAEGCTIERDDETIVLSAPQEGGHVAFTGEPGKVAGVDWTSSRFLVFDAFDHEAWTLGVVFRLWSLDGASGGDSAKRPDMNITMGLMPGIPTRLSLPLSALDSQTMFMPRTPGKLKTVIVGERLDPTRIVRLELGVMPSHAPQRLSITNIRMADDEPEYPVPEVVLVDEMGQYTGREWPGKTPSVAQMISDLKERRRAAIDGPRAFGSDRDSSGGWTGSPLEPSGFFRTHHDGARWWLIDPEGNPFFSTGPDCVRPEIECPVEGIEQLFAWLPPKNGLYAEAWYRSDRHERTFFDFGIANLIRAFGPQWRTAWETMTAHHLRAWGFNTIANWSDRGITRSAGMPYVWPLADFPTTSATIFRDFPDVFSDEFQTNAESFARQLDEFRDDPLLIGYFLRNEPTWAFVHGLIIAEEVLATDTATASRKALAAHLSQAYAGDVGKLNAAWKSDFATFAELETRVIPHASRLSQAANEDLVAFSRIMIRRYVEIPSTACRRVDPDHLNLGMRYAYVASDLLLEGSDCFDVFSINCYQMDPTDHIDAVGKAVNLPIMIGEYHFGALDRGLVANALRGVATQRDRGVAYRYYLERAAANPHCVGAHYFTIADEATLGRYDGENWNIGVEDVCRRPYEEFVEGVVLAHKTLYDVASGRVPPTEVLAPEVARNAF